MKIVLPKVDLRSNQNGRWRLEDDGGTPVGHYSFRQHAGREVILFGKYAGSFETQQEAQAFVDGVVAVLNHMTDRSGISN